MSRNVLVVVAHPDDEVLGMGGAIAKHVRDGDNVFCVSMTDGVSSRSDKAKSSVEKRAASADAAARALGFSWLKRLKFNDNALDSYPLLEIIKSIEHMALELKPYVVYTHHPGDLNVDHRTVFEAVLTIFRPKSEPFAEELRLFEVPSSTEFALGKLVDCFKPNLFVDISTTINLKLDAVSCYSQEILPPPHPRSLEGIENLARYRGNQVALEHAEAFEIVRRVES